jgi:hypothetical protein
LREGKLPLALENIGLNAFGTDNLAKPVSIMIDELPNNLITI